MGTDPTVSECDHDLNDLADTDRNYLERKPKTELRALFRKLQTCRDLHGDDLGSNETTILDSVDADLRAILGFPEAHRNANGQSDRPAALEESAPVRPEPPQLKSGDVEFYPMDMGQTFSFYSGNTYKACSATSPQRLVCGDEPFLGSIVAQQNHEFLVGCKPSYADDSCMTLPARSYHVLVHGKTMSVIDSGMVSVNTQTGKTLGYLNPVFSILAVVK